MKKFQIIFLLAERLTPIIPPTEPNSDIITNRNGVLTVIAPFEIIKAIAVIIKNIIKPTAAPIIIPFDLCKSAAINPPANAPADKHIFDIGTAVDSSKSLNVRAKAQSEIKIITTAKPIAMPIAEYFIIGFMLTELYLFIIINASRNMLY